MNRVPLLRRPLGPHHRWGGALAPSKRFAARQNLDAGRIHSARADEIIGVPKTSCVLGLADAMIWQGVSY